VCVPYTLMATISLFFSDFHSTYSSWDTPANMRWRAADQEVDQKGHGDGDRLWKTIAKHAVWTGMMLWIVVDERS